MGAMNGSEKDKGASKPPRLPVLDGAFAITTDGLVLANNTEEGPQAARAPLPDSAPPGRPGGGAAPDDEPAAVEEQFQPTVEGLKEAAAQLQSQGTIPFLPPLRWDDAGWVANRWCELLPVAMSAKQRLMELEDPVTRLRLVDEFLRSRQVLKD